MPDLDRILTHLNPQQQEAVLATGHPLLILAGAGSGKTRVLIHRVAYLIEAENVPAENILLVTFTNKAANEMKERLAQITLNQSSAPLACTFHSFCARLLRQEAHQIGLSPGFTIYDEKDQLETVKQAMVQAGLGEKKFDPDAIRNAISAAKNELIGPADYQQIAKGFFQQAAASTYPAYQKILREYQALDFDDLLTLAVKLLEQPAIKKKYRQQFTHLLVDEYQDTNRAQYQLTVNLAGKGTGLCVVGDCAQSIYSWRGADYRNLLSLEKDFQDLKTINLEQNYRSTKNILSAANRVIAQNSTHPILNLWTQNESGDKISLFQARNETEEAFFIADTIQNLVRAGHAWQDFAVLYRTNAQSRVIEEVFLKNGLPYLLVGGTRFYDRTEVKDCLAYLRLMANPVDLIAYKRAEKTGKRRLSQFFEYFEKKKGKNTPTLELLDGILAATGYLEKYNPKKEPDAARLENIKELRSVALESPGLGDFLENVSLIQHETLPQNQKGWSKKQAITLMTTHAAKGTEFEIVFLIGMEEGLLPHSRSLMIKEALEEERRLAYVGMTRAKKRLYLTLAKRRLYFGKRNNNPPSRFLHEIPPELIDYFEQPSPFARINQEADDDYS